MAKTLPLLLTLLFMALFVAGLVPGRAFAFEAGQRWSCVTDQGAQAYLEISKVEGEAVSFSWGVLNPETNELDRLCNKRDALSVEEMSDFCQLLGKEFSEGHVLLHKGCAEEGSNQ